MPSLRRSALAAPIKSATCYKCSKQGHKSLPIKETFSNHHCKICAQYPFCWLCTPSDSQAESNADDTNFHLFTMSSGANTSSINVEVLVNTTLVIFQVDTGASLSMIINIHDYQKFLADSTSLAPSSKQLHTYTGHQVKVVGECFSHSLLSTTADQCDSCTNSA